jgi:superfamily II DNA/RNA helicase
MITLLSKGRARARMPRSLVLCPTRELAAQVAENFDTYSKHVKLTKALLIGGVSFKEQDLLIDRGVDVLIATPGRLLDHFERGKLLLTGVQIMVVDEADRMLDMGFIPDIERIFSLTPFTRQTFFFSATMAPEIERITNTFLSNPAKIEVARQATASETITQSVVHFRASRRDALAKEKRAILRALIDAEGEACTNAIVFCNRKTEVDVLAKSLPSTATTPRRSTATSTSRSAPGRSTASARASCASSSPPTWPPAGSTSRPSPMSSTSTCRAMPRTTSTASAAPAARAARARRS